MEMTGVGIVIVMAVIFVWGAVSARLERADLSAPIIFVAVGAVLAAFSLVNAKAAPETLKPLVETTLVWVLFSDAARVPVRDLREDLGRCVRLLGAGLRALPGSGGVARPAGRGSAGAHRRRPGRARGHQRRGAFAGATPHHGG